MRNVLRTILLLLCLIPASAIRAQGGGDITVGDIQTPSLRWGRQTVYVPLTNTTDYLKYVSIVTTIKFQGAYLSPERSTRTNYLLEPSGNLIAAASIDIPGSFGQADMTVTAYDVVDTLDQVLPYQKFFSQPFTLHFHIPDGLTPYVQEKITLPPAVGSNPFFDNEFSRVILVLLSEGKSSTEIAQMAMADTSYIGSLIRSLRDQSYIAVEKTGIKLSFPLIGDKEADEARALANSAATELAAVIQKNLPAYAACRDSLIAAKAMSGDSNTFMDPGAVLFRPYPVIGALLLWNDLGKKFITDSLPLEIFEGSDPCNAHIPKYMYAVLGGEIVNGSQFFNLTYSGTRQIIWYGDTIPALKCPENLYFNGRLAYGAGWNYVKDDLPEAFMFKPGVTSPAVAKLARGTSALLKKLSSDLGALTAKYQAGQVNLGARYWFWNLVATKTLKDLIASGATTRRGNGQFKIEEGM